MPLLTCSKFPFTPPAGHRLGSALVDRAATWAAQHGLQALTLPLTTFAEVPWNAPYDARLGFQLLDEHKLTDGLRRLRQHEAALGLDRWPRVAMARRVAPRTEPDVVSASQ